MRLFAPAFQIVKLPEYLQQKNQASIELDRSDGDYDLAFVAGQLQNFHQDKR